MSIGRGEWAVVMNVWETLDEGESFYGVMIKHRETGETRIIRSATAWKMAKLGLLSEDVPLSTGRISVGKDHPENLEGIDLSGTFETQRNIHPGYKELKNYIHNELGLTRDVIQDMIHQMVKNEADTIINNRRQEIKHQIDKSVYQIIKETLQSRHGLLTNDFKGSIMREISSAITKRLMNEINLKLELSLSENVTETSESTGPIQMDLFEYIPK